jgi:hypothetical protein
MKVYLNEVTGIADAIVSMMMSKRTWTREGELEIRAMCDRRIDRQGKYNVVNPAHYSESVNQEINEIDKKYNDYLDLLVKWGWKHITMLRFIDFSITVEGLHRAGQDDWDAHASRYNNRIIRSSTRLATFGNEVSEWYDDKIIPTDVALASLGITTPESITHNGVVYVRSTNGYVREDLKDNKDVKRGLYMLSIPSNFIFKVNLCEWAHVFKERNIDGTANPEVKICCESIADQIERFQPKFNRELFEKIKN